MADDAADEAATRYDRQVRLWGASTQQKLQRTSVSLHATGGVAVETAKNLCLAGIGAMLVVDTGVVCADDLAVTHLVHHSEVGQPRGPIVAARLRDMNPLVATTAAATGTASTTAAATSAAVAYNVTVVSPSSSAMLQEVLRARMAATPAGGGTAAGLVVSLVQVGPFTFGLLVPLGVSDGGAAANEALMQAVLQVLGEDGGTLRGKPKALQLAVLALHCGGGAAVPFPAMLQRLLRLREELSAESVDDDGLQLLLDTHCLAPDRERPSAVDATIGGGVCAQCIINTISDGGAGGLQWFALETRGRIECVVGP